MTWVFGVGERNGGEGHVFYTLVTSTADSGVEARGGGIAEFRAKKPALLLAAILHHAAALPFLDEAFVRQLRDAPWKTPAADEYETGPDDAGAFVVSLREGILTRRLATLTDQADAEKLITLLRGAERVRL